MDAPSFTPESDISGDDLVQILINNEYYFDLIPKDVLDMVLEGVELDDIINLCKLSSRFNQRYCQNRDERLWNRFGGYENTVLLIQFNELPKDMMDQILYKISSEKINELCYLSRKFRDRYCGSSAESQKFRLIHQWIQYSKFNNINESDVDRKWWRSMHKFLLFLFQLNYNDYIMLQSHASIDIRQILKYLFSPKINFMIGRYLTLFMHEGKKFGYIWAPESLSIEYIYDSEMLEYIIKLLLEIRRKLLTTYKPREMRVIDEWIGNLVNTIARQHNISFFSEFIKKIAVDYPEIYEKVNWSLARHEWHGSIVKKTDSGTIVILTDQEENK